MNLSGIFRSNIEALRRFIRRRAGPRLLEHESASDLTQSTMRELLQAESRLQERSELGLRRWLFRAAECKIRNRARYWAAMKRGSQNAQVQRATVASAGPDPIAPDPGPSSVLQIKEVAEQLERALNHLSYEDREVIRLVRQEGLSHAEIAHRMERSEAAVRKVLSRALSRFAAEFERQG